MHEHYTRLGEEIPLPIALIAPLFLLIGGFLADTTSEALIWFVFLGFGSSFICGRVRRYKWSAAYFFLFDLTWPGLVIYFLAVHPLSGVGLFPDSAIEAIYRFAVSAAALLSFFQQSLWNAGRLNFFFSLSQVARLVAFLATFVLLCSAVEYNRRLNEEKKIQEELVASFPVAPKLIRPSVPTFLPAPSYSLGEVELLRRFGQRELENKHRQRDAIALMLGILPVGLTAALALRLASVRAKPRVESVTVE